MRTLSFYHNSSFCLLRLADTTNSSTSYKILCLLTIRGICHSVSKTRHRVALTFDLACRWAFRWAKVRSKSRLKSKSKVISLSERYRPNLRSKYSLRPKLSWTLVKLNFGLSLDLSVQLKVSLSDSLSKRLSQKLKSPNAFTLQICMWLAVFIVYTLYTLHVVLVTDEYYVFSSFWNFFSFTCVNNCGRLGWLVCWLLMQTFNYHIKHQCWMVSYDYFSQIIHTYSS